MRVAAVIPARMASTRFPGKPLADILGLPMIEHVRRRVALSGLFNTVAVATCDDQIMKSVQSHGGKAVLTSTEHERCTDRVAEASASLDADVIVNVQGDEPLVRPEMLELLVKPLFSDSDLLCTNLISVIVTEAELNDRNVVKTVFDKSFNALYFSRSPIPGLRQEPAQRVLGHKQLGIIAFRKEFLLRFAALPPTPLEIGESVDMLRAVEHGFKVRTVLGSYESVGVDVPAQLNQVAEIMKRDDLFPRYRPA
jgi:3-deoxy-manno-octulosonate cytidylyltransferase (CMP-KDO synthetase)